MFIRVDEDMDHTLASFFRQLQILVQTTNEVFHKNGK